MVLANSTPFTMRGLPNYIRQIRSAGLGLFRFDVYLDQTLNLHLRSMHADFEVIVQISIYNSNIYILNSTAGNKNTAKINFIANF